MAKQNEDNQDDQNKYDADADEPDTGMIEVDRIIAEFQQYGYFHPLT